LQIEYLEFALEQFRLIAEDLGEERETNGNGANIETRKKGYLRK
jgi:hypothetical protein